MQVQWTGGASMEALAVFYSVAMLRAMKAFSSQWRYQ